MLRVVAALDEPVESILSILAGQLRLLGKLRCRKLRLLGEITFGKLHQQLISNFASK